MNKFITAVVLSFSFLFTSHAHAAVCPLSIAIVPPLQFPSDDFTITGLRASVLYGKHQDVYGFDLGLIGNVTTQTFVGIGIAGGFNMTKGRTTAIGGQIAGIAN